MGIYNIGGPSYSLPILDTSYPKDITMREQANGQATFEVKITRDGFPNDYKYQWYENNEAISGATGASYTKTGLTKVEDTERTVIYNIYCQIRSDAGSINSRTAVLTLKSTLPTFTGNATVKREGTYNWLITVPTTTTLNFTDFGTGNGAVDVFCVGGGGGGGGSNSTEVSMYRGGGGGAGGYVRTYSNLSLSTNTNIKCDIGTGGTGGAHTNNGQNGNVTYFMNTNYKANGGGGGSCTEGYAGHGGSGGGGGGTSGSATRKGGRGGSNGGDGYGYNDVQGNYNRGTGEGLTTHGFGESTYNLYAGGGGGGAGISRSGLSDTSISGQGKDGGGNGGGIDRDTGTGQAGTNNTGGGGGGAAGGGSSISHSGGKGGSGVILIRNHR